jgi:hypothetical protein
MLLNTNTHPNTPPPHLVHTLLDAKHMPFHFPTLGLVDLILSSHSVFVFLFFFVDLCPGVVSRLASVASVSAEVQT